MIGDMNVQQLPLDKIEQNENSRVIYKQADVAELMGSMKQEGQLQPVGVRKIPGTKDKFEAVWGNCRILAAKKLGWANIAASIVAAEKDEDRDFLNLVENVKRKNLTLDEEGRMYDRFLAKGLRVEEIAARLGVSRMKIETALDAFRFVPNEMRGKIVNRVGGTKPKGTVSATAYRAAAQARKNHSLSRVQFRTLLKFASEDDTSVQHVQAVAPFLKEVGGDIDKAIKKMQQMDRMVLTVFIPQKRRIQLEKKHDKTFHELAYDLIEAQNWGVTRKASEEVPYEPRLSQLRKKFGGDGESKPIKR